MSYAAQVSSAGEFDQAKSVQASANANREDWGQHNPEPLWFFLVLLFMVAAFLYLALFAYPNIPFLQAGDQMYFWVGAQRVLFGEHIYSDFLQFTPPGTDLIYLTFLKMLGPRIWLPNLVNILLGVALCASCFRIARHIMERWMAVLATSLFLVLTYASSLNGTHHWFSLLAIAGAIDVMMWGPTNATRTTLAGALLGVASFFTQTHGAFALLGLSLFLVWEANYRTGSRKIIERLSCVVLGFSIALGALSAYFVGTVGWRQLWYFQVTYAGKYVAYGQHPLFFGILPTWHNLPLLTQFVFVLTGLPIAYALVLWRGRRGPVNGSRPLLLLSLVGLSLWVEVCFSANYLRLYAVGMPGLILMLWMCERSGRARGYAIALLLTGIIGLGVHEIQARHHKNSVIADLPTGRVALPAEANEKLSWLMQHTHPGQFVFQATAPMLYFSLQLRNPVFLNEITENESTRPADVERVIHELDGKEVEFVLWSPYNNYPNPEFPSSYHLKPLRDYLDTHYHRVHIFSDEDETWQRNKR